MAFNKGVNVPDGCIIDSKGQPTTDPKVFYGDPPGAILSIAGHKGYALGIITEMLAGALTGGGASNPANAEPAGQRHAVDLHGARAFSGGRGVCAPKCGDSSTGSKARKRPSPTARS